jgi:hypothetical protein
VTEQFRSGEVFGMDVGRMDTAVKPTGMYSMHKTSPDRKSP